jgi:hypothetical protein
MPSAAPAIVALDRDGLTLDCATKICSGTGLSTLQRWLGATAKPRSCCYTTARASPSCW